MDRKITFIDWHDGVQKVAGIGAIRQFGQAGLKEARGIIDGCLEGVQTSFLVAEDMDPIVVAKAIAVLGFSVKVEDQIIHPEQREPTRKYLQGSIGIFMPQELQVREDKKGFEIVGELLSGKVNAGNKIGIPMNEGFTVSSVIFEVRTENDQKFLLIELEDEDLFELDIWETMNVLGDELPIYPSKLE